MRSTLCVYVCVRSVDGYTCVDVNIRALFFGGGVYFYNNKHLQGEQTYSILWKENDILSLTSVIFLCYTLSAIMNLHRLLFICELT